MSKIVFYFVANKGNMRAAASNKYLATVYDDFGRAIKTGCTTTSDPTTTAANAATTPVPIAAADLLTQTNYYPNSSWVQDQGAKVLAPTGEQTYSPVLEEGRTQMIHGS